MNKILIPLPCYVLELSSISADTKTDPVQLIVIVNEATRLKKEFQKLNICFAYFCRSLWKKSKRENDKSQRIPAQRSRCCIRHLAAWHECWSWKSLGNYSLVNCLSNIFIRLIGFSISITSDLWFFSCQYSSTILVMLPAFFKEYSTRLFHREFSLQSCAIWFTEQIKIMSIQEQTCLTSKNIMENVS